MSISREPEVDAEAVLTAHRWGGDAERIIDVDALDDDELRRLARASSLALDPGEYADVPGLVAARLRALCLGLPQAAENQAWAGFQWRIRKRIFAHLLTVDFPGGPVTVLTFRSSGPELEVLRSSGHPFFEPAWGADTVGVVLDCDGAAPGWEQIGELVTESYCLMAPRKLVTQLGRLPGTPGS